MRAVVDTDLLVTALIRPRGAIGGVLARLREARFVAVVSPATLDGVVAVLSRPGLCDKYGIDEDAVETFLRFMLLRAELVKPAVGVRRCRDRRDDELLEAALGGRADRLVTGDADLLALGTVGPVKIVSPASFVAEIE